MLYHLIAFSAAVATGAADEDCVGYHYKINGVCTGVQQFPGATGCGTAEGAKDSHPLYLDKAFCQEFGTGRDPLDQQVSMVSWGNLGKASVPEYKGEVNDPTMPSGCVTHAMHNFYQWNNAQNGAANSWWRPVCMEDIAPPTMPPTDRTFTKCKEYTPDRAMSIKNGGDSVAVQLCKVINGNVMTPMWDNGKASDCGTDSALIAASTDSIGDCQALCDAHPKCLGWWMWDQTILPAPFTKDDQGCYLFENGTPDQLVPDRVMDSAIAAGVCFPPAEQECLHVDANPGTCAQRSLKGLGWLTAAEAMLEDNFTGTFEECVAHLNSMGQQGAGYVKYVEGQSCTTFVIRVCIPPATSPPFCPVVPTEPPTMEPTDATPPPSSPPTDNTDCEKVMLKSGSMCLHTQGNNASSMWMTCPAPGSNDPLFQFDIISADPTNPDLVKIRNNRGQFISYQSPWQDSAMTRDWSSMYVQVWERRVTTAGVQFYNAGRGAFLSSDPAVNGGFAGFTTTDSPAASTFASESAGCASGPAPSMPPTEPPTTCDCRKTDATHAEGARCMDPLGNTIGYRQTINWCCSDYGCSKGYEWVNPADDQCKDDNFVGTCMFNFIGAGGCDTSNPGADDTIMAAVDPACFECDHIGDLVEQECSGQQGPLNILSDMINDARRLSGTPLPASDPELVKMNKRIAKIRTLLKQKKLDTKTALGKHHP